MNVSQVSRHSLTIAGYFCPSPASNSAMAASAASGVVGGVVLPAAPEHSHPAGSDTAEGSVFQLATVESCQIPGPGWRVDPFEDVSPVGAGGAETPVAGVADPDSLHLSRGQRYRSQAGLGQQHLRSGEPWPVFSDLGEELRGDDITGRGEAGVDLGVWMLFEQLCHLPVIAAELGVQQFELVGESEGSMPVSCHAPRTG